MPVQPSYAKKLHNIIIVSWTIYPDMEVYLQTNINEGSPVLSRLLKMQGTCCFPLSSRANCSQEACGSRKILPHFQFKQLRQNGNKPCWETFWRSTMHHSRNLIWIWDVSRSETDSRYNLCLKPSSLIDTSLAGYNFKLYFYQKKGHHWGFFKTHIGQAKQLFF